MRVLNAAIQFLIAAISSGAGLYAASPVDPSTLDGKVLVHLPQRWLQSVDALVAWRSHSRNPDRRTLPRPA